MKKVLVKKCKRCDRTDIIRDGMCYEHFRELCNERLREYRKKYPERFKQYEINKLKEWKCKRCGKIFKRYKRGDGHCSRQCNYEDWKENGTRKGMNNPGYRNGNYTKESIKKDYANKTTQKHLGACRKYRIAFRKEHDWDSCELCGTTGAMRYETHHIIFASEVPGHEELHNFRNLIYVCINCHNKLHKNKKLRNELVKNRNLNELFNRNLIVYDKRNVGEKSN